MREFLHRVRRQQEERPKRTHKQPAASRDAKHGVCGRRRCHLNRLKLGKHDVRDGTEATRYVHTCLMLGRSAGLRAQDPPRNAQEPTLLQQRHICRVWKFLQPPHEVSLCCTSHQWLSRSIPTRVSPSSRSTQWQRQQWQRCRKSCWSSLPDGTKEEHEAEADVQGRPPSHVPRTEHSWRKADFRATTATQTPRTRGGL